MAPATKRKSNQVSDEFIASDDDTSNRPQKRTKQPASSFQPASQAQIDSDGNKYWEISKVRRVTISEFKGMSMVNIREYYEKDGQALPGKKGISMTIEQYSALIHLLPQIEDLLQQKGETVPRPNYSNLPAHKDDPSNGDEEDEVKPSNFEATSDEDA